jgi:hypothetical protein
VTKTSPETPRRTKRPHAGEAKAAPVAPRARQRENAAEKRAREVALIETEVVKRGIKAKPLIAAPLPEVLSDTEKTKRPVLQALGHDADGKCPAGDEASVKRWLLFANHHLPAMNPDEFYSGPACGWLWCHKRDGFKATQWTDLLEALKILDDNGINPNSAELVELAKEYASGTDWRKLWRALGFNHLDAA